MDDGGIRQRLLTGSKGFLNLSTVSNFSVLKLCDTYSPSQPLGAESRNAPGVLRDSSPRACEGDYADVKV